MKIISILMIAPFLLMSCTHIPQPPFYGNPEEHPDWRKSKQVDDYRIPFSEPENITLISYYYLKCEKCEVVFKSIMYQERCPKCKEIYGRPPGEQSLAEKLIVFIIFFPLFVLQYGLGG